MPQPQPAGPPGPGTAFVLDLPDNVSPINDDRSRISGDSPPITTATADAEKANPSASASASTVQPPAAGSPAAPVSAALPVVADGVSLPTSPTASAPSAPEKTAKITMRSVLQNPFADDGDAPTPPAPAEEAAPTAGSRVAAPGAGPGDLVNKAVPDRPGGQDPQPASEKSPALEAALARRPSSELGAAAHQGRERATGPGRVGAARSGTPRQERRQERRARAQRFAEQVKFHAELAELIRTQGKKAGPDIETLAKRNGSEGDPDRRARGDLFLAKLQEEPGREGQVRPLP